MQFKIEKGEGLKGEIIIPGDMLITMGAGDIWRYSESYSKYLHSQMDGDKG